MAVPVIVQNPKRVLIVRLSAIGDTILTTPLLAAIKDQLPETEVDWVVEPKSRAILDMCQGVSMVHTFPRFPGWDGIRHPSKMKVFYDHYKLVTPQMRQRDYDVALIVQDRFKSSIASIASGAKVKIGWRLGDSEEVNWASSTHWLTMPRGLHVVDTWRSMARAIGCVDAPARFPLVPPQDAMDKMKSYLDTVRTGGPIVILNVGSSKADRRWTADSYSDVAKHARADFNALSIFTWGNETEREVVEAVVANSDGAAIVSEKTTLFTLAAMIAQSDAFVGGDTGPTHLAAALGIPIVGVYAASNPYRTGPYGDQHLVVNKFPEYQKGDMEAMDSITAQDVYYQLAQLLSRRHSPVMDINTVSISPSPLDGEGEGEL